MEFKRSYSGEIIGIIVTIVITFFAIAMMQSPSSSSSQGDTFENRMHQLRESQKDAKLEEKPMTVQQAEWMVGSIGSREDETPEERTERLQKVVEEYNKKLKSEQESIKKEREEKQKSDNQFITIILSGAGIFITILGISAFVKSRQPSALAISDDKIDIKASVFRDVSHIDLSSIKKIQYKIITHRYDDSTHTYRMLYFLDYRGNEIERLDLNELSGADFNQIQREISQRAPHIEWIFPS